MTRTNRPAGRTTRRGANLTASLVATGVVVVALLMVLQGYYHCSEALKRTQNRSRALMVLESQAETIRAAGFGALPPVGQHAMPAEALQGLPGASGSLIVKDGPSRDMRLVTLDLQWRDGDQPVGESEILFAMSKHGLDP